MMLVMLLGYSLKSSSSLRGLLRLGEEETAQVGARIKFLKYGTVIS